MTTDRLFDGVRVEDLGDTATEEDLSAFLSACYSVLPHFEQFEDESIDLAINYIWHDGAWTERLHVTVCIYCDGLIADGTVIPAVDDDDGWAQIAGEHVAGCEWVVTRAHRDFEEGR